MGSPIDVVIPAYNGWELTRSCVEHLRAQTVPHAVFVADNGSTDGTPGRLRESFPEVQVLELGANLGFATACNRGVQQGGGEIVVLMNNDVECPPHFLERLTAPFRGAEDVGSVAALLLKPGEERIESFGLTADRTLAGFPRLRGWPARAAQVQDPVLVGPSGAAGAYRRTAWEAIGGLDEGVFSYGEDVDLALRIRAAGWATTGAADAAAIHIGSASAGPRSAWQRYQGGFARGYFLRRYGILRSRQVLRALATELVVVLGDAIIFSHDLAALRGRIAGWKAARRMPRHPLPPRDAVDAGISFFESLQLRFDVYTEFEPSALGSASSANTPS